MRRATAARASACLSRAPYSGVYGSTSTTPTTGTGRGLDANDTSARDATSLSRSISTSNGFQEPTGSSIVTSTATWRLDPKCPSRSGSDDRGPTGPQTKTRSEYSVGSRSRQSTPGSDGRTLATSNGRLAPASHVQTTSHARTSPAVTPCAGQLNQPATSTLPDRPDVSGAGAATDGRTRSSARRATFATRRGPCASDGRVGARDEIPERGGNASA